MQVKRSHYDPVTGMGIGYPTCFNLTIAGSQAADVQCRLDFPAPSVEYWDAPYARGGTTIAVLGVARFGLRLQPGNAGSETDTYCLAKNGTVIATAVFTGSSSPAATATTVDLRDSKGKGVSVVAGDYLTCYASAVSTATPGKDINVTVWGECYGNLQ
jgi:hypothetical protein